MKDHFVICGLGHVGYRIAELFHQIGETFVVITREIRPEWRETVELQSARFIIGDARLPAILHAADLQTARAVLVVTNSDLINIEISLDIQKLFPDVPLIVRIFETFLSRRAQREMRVRSVLSPGLLTAPVFVAAAQGDGMIRAFDMRGSKLNVFELAFDEFASGVGSPIYGFCERRGLIPLSLASSNHGDGTVQPEDTILSDDRLTVMAREEETNRLRKEGVLPQRETRQERNRPLRRLMRAIANPLRPLRSFVQAWRKSSSVLRFAFFALNGLFVASVIVFHRFLPDHPSWVDSVYFTVTMMTTVGFGDYTLRAAPDWIKLFGCGIMISGAVLVAIVFSLVTDYIVSARVEQALGRRTTPLADHVVVVGLGDVGTRVAEELYRSGEAVVAIERDPDHEAAPGLQDRIQVIVGDANRESTMNQANFAQARVVIVTTTDDLVSLRIAHQAEGVNPKLRTVVRIYDSALAGKVSAGLGIARAVNSAQTAASTFVACALAEDVEQSFVLGSRLLAVRHITQGGPDSEGFVASITDGALVLQEYDPNLKSWSAAGCRFSSAAT